MMNPSVTLLEILADMTKRSPINIFPTFVICRSRFKECRVPNKNTHFHKNYVLRRIPN